MEHIVISSLLAILMAVPAWGQAKPESDTAFFALPLEGFFPGEAKKGGGGPKRLNVYLIRRDGKWTSALGTPTNQGRPVWNTAFMPIDPSGLKIEGGRIAGQVAVTLVPDPWVPKDQKVRQATVMIDAVLARKPGGEGATVTGEWKATIPGDAAELAAAELQPAGAGRIQGSMGKPPLHDLSDASYDLAMYNLIPGKTVDPFQRRRAIAIGIKEGKVVSGRFGQMDLRHSAYDYESFDVPTQFNVSEDGFAGSVAFAATTLDGDQAEFSLKLQGQRVDRFMWGTYEGTCAIEGQPPRAVSGFFRGDVRKGAFVSDMAKDDRPWFVIDPAVKPFAPGEHPRLFFRKADLQELKRRAATPEGQQIIRRLRELLNGSDGESMPTQFNPAKQAYDKNNFKAKPGAYSISHAAGFGFLYQLTGDRKYADLARQCVELAWKGQRDFDDRYAWVAPGGELRAGPSIAWHAVAYDLCYDAWDPGFRVKVAQAIQDYHDAQGGEWAQAAEGGISLERMILTPKQGPGSNHYGAVIGGSGLAVLAIKDDPGVDKAKLDKYAQVLERQVIRHMIGGWGDGGYYKEGWGASTVGTQAGYLCLLQAYRVATGKDFLNGPRPNASYITMVPRSLMLLGPPAVFPYRSNMGGTYGSAEFYRERSGFSHGGHFSEGFGAIADRYKPVLLWTYNHIVEPDPAARTFDTLSLYPHRAMLALINWPTFAGIGEQNPSEVMPLATRDRLYDYFVFRNRFQDKDDVVATVLIKQPDGTKPRDVMVWGMGQRVSLGEPERGAMVTHYRAGRDGSGTLSAGRFAMAVDYSRASGADALILTANTTGKISASAGPAQVTTVQVGGVEVNILTLSLAGKHPQVRVDGDRIIAGGQTITFNGATFALPNPVDLPAVDRIDPAP